MNEENFKQGIRELKNIRMTDTEKARMLEKVFSAPVESPYMRHYPMFAFVFASHTRIGLALFLILALSFGGAVYASEASLPGDLLYPIKTRVVESVLDVVNSTPEKKIVWEGEKVERRIKEAEKLAEKNELNDEHAERLEREIEKGSIAFINAVNAAASSSVPTTPSALKRAEDLKQEFRRKIKESEGKRDNEIQSEKIEKIKTSIIKILDDEGKLEDKSESSKNRRDDKDDGDENKNSDRSGRNSDD
ncbi:MAG: DUF5667 domain-containing protein [bacterium]|nr:DUF5667 domain-containing protein [bacterium]